MGPMGATGTTSGSGTSGTSQTLSDVEAKLQEAQKSMAQALEDFERNETAKFHQIYDTLKDLCTKQFKLEENVAAIESEMRSAYMNSQMVPMVMCPMNAMQSMQPFPMMPGIMPFPMPGSLGKSSSEVQTERTERTESTEAETPTSTACAMKDVKDFEKESESH